MESDHQNFTRMNDVGHCSSVHTDKQTGGWADGWADGWSDGWMDGWMDGLMDI